jgi:hypothetical protein
MGESKQQRREREGDLFSSEPHSELGHTPEQVREIRETGRVPEPAGKPDPGGTSTNVSPGDQSTTTTTTTAAPDGDTNDDGDQIPFAGDDSGSTKTSTTTTTKAPKKD